MGANQSGPRNVRFYNFCSFYLADFLFCLIWIFAALALFNVYK